MPYSPKLIALDSSIKAFETLGNAIGKTASTLSDLTLSFGQVASNQLGLEESELQPQPSGTVGNSSFVVSTAQGVPWPQALSIEYANRCVLSRPLGRNLMLIPDRYMQSAFCTWYSTGGEITGVLNQLPLSDLNATGTFTAGQTGKPFAVRFMITLANRYSQE